MLARHLIQLLCELLRRNTEAMSAFAFLDLDSRLARKLHDLALAHAERDGTTARFTRRFSQTDLGQMLGATREAVNKRLAVLTLDGLVTQADGVFVIPDSSALAARAPSVRPSASADRASSAKKKSRDGGHAAPNAGPIRSPLSKRATPIRGLFLEGQDSGRHAIWVRGQKRHSAYIFEIQEKIANNQDGGAEGNRTPDLNIANVALSQLSYSPVLIGHAAGAVGAGSRWAVV